MKGSYLIPLVLVFLVFSACAESEPGPAQTSQSTQPAAQPLTADFTAAPTEGMIPFTVQFTDSSTGVINSWNWDFGDGETSTLQNPAHEYTNSSMYTVSLTISGPSGSTTMTKERYINAKEPFTEFYILGSKEAPQDYPTELTVGQDGKVIIGIVNREGRPLSYKVDIVLDGEKIAHVDSIRLNDSEEWEHEVYFVPGTVGDGQKLEFELYRVGDTEPYLFLYLWVDVKP